MTTGISKILISDILDYRDSVIIPTAFTVNTMLRQLAKIPYYAFINYNLYNHNNYKHNF